MTPGFLFTALAYVVGGMVFFLASRSRRLATEGMARIALWGVCGGVVGAKMSEWLLFHRHVLGSQPGAFFDPQTGGRSVLGGVLIGWICVEIAKRQLGVRRSTGDLFALALPAGEAVGRIGCFFHPCCVGVKCERAWAVFQDGAWRHPSQIYLSLGALLVFVVLLQLRSRRRREGDLWKLYLVLWGASRLIIEFWREREIVFGALSFAQCVGAAVAATGLLLLFQSRRQSTGSVQASPSIDSPSDAVHEYSRGSATN